jgi:antitoxin Phd
MQWQLQDAKNRFSRLVDQALTEGPQIVTRRGREVVVVVSVDTYESLIAKDDSFVSFMQSSPLGEVDLDLERSKDIGREVSL